MGSKERCRIMARHYKKNRVSRKGETPYMTYQRKYAKVREEGYAMMPMIDEKEFKRLYDNAKRAGYSNFMRDLPLSQRYVTKPEYYRLRKEVNKQVDEIINDQKADPEQKLYAKAFKENYGKMTFETMKKWNNEDWTSFRASFIDLGGTYEEFRGIYE